MKKISSQDAQALLKQAGAAIRFLEKERDDLMQKVATFELDDRVTKIARDMEEKDLEQELTFEEKVAQLKESKNLDITEEAIKLAAPQGSGRLLGNPDEIVTGGGSSAFETYILTGEDPA